MKKTKLLSAAAAVIMAVSMMSAVSMNAWAANSGYGGLVEGVSDTNQDGSVNTTELKKSLVIRDGAKIPDATFTFNVTPGAAVSATESTFAVIKGVNPEKIKFGEEEQADGNGTIKYEMQDKPAEGTTTDDGVTIADTSDGYYIATKSVKLDFSQCGFTEPGIYRYIITETGTNAGIKNDINNTRTVDVYVEDATTGTDKKLKIAGYVMYVGTLTTGPSKTVTSAEGFTAEDGVNTITPSGNLVSDATKSVGFKNVYLPHDLTFCKQVTGNQGSKDKYFKFTLNISGAVPGRVFYVDLSDADATPIKNAATKYSSMSNPSTFTVGEDGTAEVVFYIQDGQRIVIKDIADGTAYAITEDSEDYQATAEIVGDNDGTENNGVSVEDIGLTQDTTVTFTNDRSGVLPTGILVSIAPAAIIGIAVIGGIVFLVVKNKRREAEED